MVYRSRSTRRASQRRGTALVELAVCLPTLVLVFLAAIQAADTIFFKQTLHIASYETVRVAIAKKATNSAALAPGEQILNSRGVTGYVITFDPADVSSVARGEKITVSVSAPAEDNTVVPAWFFGNRDVTVQAKMVKE